MYACILGQILLGGAKQAQDGFVFMSQRHRIYFHEITYTKFFLD